MMISRHWTGVCKKEREQDYTDHLKNETFVKLRLLRGFRKATILTRSVPDGIEFLITTEWESLDAVKQFAGEDFEVAVVPLTVQEMMVRFDKTVKHYFVAFRTDLTTK